MSEKYKTCHRGGWVCQTPEGCELLGCPYTVEGGDPTEKRPPGGEESEPDVSSGESVETRSAGAQRRVNRPDAAGSPSPQEHEPRVSEMALCESRHLMLKPDQLYRFSVIDGCKACAEAAAEAVSVPDWGQHTNPSAASPQADSERER